jgi:hypothetical protein
MDVAKSPVENYRVRHRKPPSPPWKTFLRHHAKALVAMDFFVVPTLTFKVLCVLVILAPARRRSVHCNVTEPPTAQWTAPQVIEAFPWDEAPRYLLRIYGDLFRQRVHSIGIEEVLIAPTESGAKSLRRVGDWQYTPGRARACDRAARAASPASADGVRVLFSPLSYASVTRHGLSSASTCRAARIGRGHRGPRTREAASP